MSDADVTTLLDKLVGSLEGETGDWNDVLERSVRPLRAVEPAMQSRPGRPRRARTLLFACTAVAAAAVAALAVESPWRGGPTVLARAAAAIEAPGAGDILSESIAVHPAASPTPLRLAHVWVSDASPRRFRILFGGSRPVEIAGTVGGVSGLGYDSANDVLDPVTFQFPVTLADLDPTAFIRSALAAGRAHLDGTATIRGRQVLRIRLASQLWGRQVAVATYYVDAHTYRPVRIAVSAVTPNASPLGFPLTSISPLPYSSSPRPAKGHVSIVYDFSDYGYLAPTAANAGLTDIRAAHPHARIV